MVELSHEQRRELEHLGEKPLRVIDPGTSKVCFIIPGEVFPPIQSLFGEDESDIRETYAAQSAVAGAAGWDDPEMDVYSDYDPHRPQG